MARDGAEQLESVSAAKLGFRASLGVGHHAEHVAALVDDSGDVVQRAVRVGAGHYASTRIAVTKNHLTVLLEARQHGRLGEVAALTVPDRHSNDLAFRTLGRERDVRSLDHEVGPFAAILERSIADQCPGQDPGLAKNLEAVADAPHEPAPIRELSDLLHDRGKACHRAGAAVVAVSKTAGQDDTVAAFEVGILVPQVLELRADDLVDDPTAVAIRPCPREDNDPELHEWPDLELRRRFAASAVGAKEPTST